MAELRLSSEPRGETLIVAVGGDLDIVTSRQLDEYLTRTRREHNRIVLDLTAVEFMDTSSLAVIVGQWKRLEAAGGTLLLAGARYRYTKTLWITGLADRLPLYGSVDEALAAGDAIPSPRGNDQAGNRPAASRPPATPPGRAATDAPAGAGRRAAR